MVYRLRPIDEPAEDRSAEGPARGLIRRAWRWPARELECALEFRLSMERCELARRFKRD